MKKVAGLLLAAGKSERMGRLKPLLPLGEETFLSCLAKAITRSQLVDWRLVLGHHHEEVLTQVPHFRAKMLINADYPKGQLSSLICGLRSLDWNNLDGIMVFLIDHPLISTPMIDQLLDEFSKSPFLIVIPTYNHRRGHPVIFSRPLFEELVTAPLEEGAVIVVRRHQADVLHVPVNSEEILIDIDTPKDYEELLKKRCSGLPNPGI
jgi:molybdenum cofactor cytidylyltransferase